jgi:K+/H+ antiporter YhaU regulatory subunit KhtT
VATDLGPDFRIDEGDELVIAGTDEGTNRFTEAMA